MGVATMPSDLNLTPQEILQKILSNAINSSGWDNRLGIPDYIVGRMLSVHVLALEEAMIAKKRHEREVGAA